MKKKKRLPVWCANENLTCAHDLNTIFESSLNLMSFLSSVPCIFYTCIIICESTGLYVFWMQILVLPQTILNLTNQKEGPSELTFFSHCPAGSSNKQVNIALNVLLFNFHHISLALYLGYNLDLVFKNVIQLLTFSDISESSLPTWLHIRITWELWKISDSIQSPLQDTDQPYGNNHWCRVPLV